MPPFVMRAATPAAILLYAVAVLLFSPFVADDAHIVGRYALNAAEGLGLVYNPGERVSALTSPLHALFVTGLAMVSSDPVTLYRWIAPVLPVLAVLGALRLLRSKPTEAAIITAFGLASPFMAMWSVGGLETPILTAIITIFAAVLLRLYRRAEIRPADCYLLGALAGLAFVTRYDTILVTLPPMLALAAVAWRTRAIWIGALIALAIASSWLVFALAYYGDVLPTSFYTKMVTDRNPTMMSVMVAVNFLLVSGLVLLAPCLSLRQRDGHPFARALVLGILTSCVVFFLFALRNSGMHMMFGYRYFVPYLPALGILLAASLVRLRDWLPPVMLAGQAGLALFMVTSSINPHVLRGLPGVGQGFFEYASMTPRDYRQFIDTLEQDAQDLRAHWETTGRADQPVIGMHTGGMGYWLREFRVIEVLVSYRHDCRPTYEEVVAVPDYVQRINFVRQADRLRATFLDGAQDVEILSESHFDAGMPWEIDYAYRSNGGTYPYPAQISGACTGSVRQVADAENPS